MVVFCFFIAHSLAATYLRTLPPQGHSTVGVPNHSEGFRAILLCARKEFADNCFKLLFLYIEIKLCTYKQHTTNSVREIQQSDKICTAALVITFGHRTISG